MNYIVFDLEFNQPSSKEELISEPFCFDKEIVQIGAVKLNEYYEIVETVDIMVEPSFYKNIGNGAEKRIKLYSGRFQVSMTFAEAYKRFLDFCGEEYSLCTWGKSDIDILNKNVLIHRLEPRAFVGCFDVQAMYSERFGGAKRQISLQDAVKAERLNEYVAHNAFNDAYSTAEVLIKLKLGDVRKFAFKKTARLTGLLFMDCECASLDSAIQKLRGSRIECGCGARALADCAICLGKSKAIASFLCKCGKEYFAVAVISKREADKGMNLKCYKAIMNEELKAFYLEQKGIADAIADYVKKHSRNKKIEKAR